MRHKTKSIFTTGKDIRDAMLRGEPIETSIFSAKKRDYHIIKSSTIWSEHKYHKQKGN